MNTWISLYPENPFGPAEIDNDQLIATLIECVYAFFRSRYPQWDAVSRHKRSSTASTHCATGR